MRIVRTRKVAWTPEQMLELVCDLEDYPSFIPACRSVRILSQTDGPEGRVWDAEVQLGILGIRRHLITRNRQTGDGLRMQQLSGPLKTLEGLWTFRALDTGCEVSLDLLLEPESPVLRSLLGLVGEQAADRIAAAFEERARVRFGGG